MCGSDSRESYGEVVEQMVVAAARLSQEVRRERRERREGGRVFASLQYGELLLRRKVPFSRKVRQNVRCPPPLLWADICYVYITPSPLSYFFM